MERKVSVQTEVKSGTYYCTTPNSTCGHWNAYGHSSTTFILSDIHKIPLTYINSTVQNSIKAYVTYH